MRSRAIPVRGARGFTLIEAMIATMVIGLTMAAVGYGLGMAGSTVREERRAFQRTLAITSKMQALDSTPFARLVSGADTLAMDDGELMVRGWTVARHDGNADGNADAGLLQVMVWVDADTCRTLRCDIR